MKTKTNLARLGVSVPMLLLYGVIGFYLIGLSSAQAQIYATQENNLTVIWKNKCPDLPPEAFIPATNLAEWDALTLQWACFNEHQSAQSSETLKQIRTAIKNTKYKKPITIYSVDPYCTKDFCDYGARVKKGKLYFAADPGGCPNARRTLEREIRRLARQ